MDIPVKFYQLALQASLMRLVSPTECAAVTSKAAAEATKPPLLRRLRAAVYGNFDIILDHFSRLFAAKLPRKRRVLCST